MTKKNEPIIAQASSSGKGGIGVVRISGESRDIDAIERSIHAGDLLEARRATLKRLTDQSGNLIDRVILIRFQAPASYTGEDVLEIQAHGGPAVQRMIIDRCLDVGGRVGLRMARPGEFTERAFLNGKIDLAQAEAIADLIEATSEQAARAAARSMQGDFSNRVKTLNSSAVELRAQIEATLDFPEEEIEFIENARVLDGIKALLNALDQVIEAATRGKVLRDGLSVVLSGAPNVGKSSLMNALAGDNVAIVTDIAGTTRDRIEYEINLDGLPVTLIDTAGLRKTEDPIEKIGIERTLEAIERADVVVRMTEAGSGEAMEDLAYRMAKTRFRDGVVILDVINKADIRKPTAIPEGAFVISAKTHEGIDALCERLKSIAGVAEGAEGEFMARSRHLSCLGRAREHASRALEGLSAMPLEVVAEELRLTGGALGEIVGETLPDDLLGIIFSKFCIGK
ncbi:MAG: tRNA uridine-5-carboxymethylaminomethyl(34) synthesis GTPase MnmE [Duodenibacillus sp.]|nr:tRNA uridine-5-carboxymethylaminomethyl(34) synthesis GTPase MnmE [Duodenibacillus sp.]